MNSQSGVKNIILHTHIFQIFTKDLITLKPCNHIQAACDIKLHLKATDKWTIVGEWTGAQTDCAKWLNGLGNGPRFVWRIAYITSTWLRYNLRVIMVFGPNTLERECFDGSNWAGRSLDGLPADLGDSGGPECRDLTNRTTIINTTTTTTTTSWPLQPRHPLSSHEPWLSGLANPQLCPLFFFCLQSRQLFFSDMKI